MHKSIQAFSEAIVQRHGSLSEQASLFPSHAVAVRCIQFFAAQLSSSPTRVTTRIVDLYPNDEEKPIISAVIYPKPHAKIAKIFWQHSGEGISSRRAEYCHGAFDDGRLGAKAIIYGNDSCTQSTGLLLKGPKRYQKRASTDFVQRSLNQPQEPDSSKRIEYAQFVEERFGRNLDVSLADKAKLAIRRRIAGALTANVDLHDAESHTHLSTRTEHVEGFSEDDVYLYPCGMNSIFNTHRALMACRGKLKSVSYGYVNKERLV